MCKDETYCYYRIGASENRINCFYLSYNYHCNHDFGPKEIQLVEPGHALKYIAPCSCPLRSKDEGFALDITPAFQIPWPLRDLEMSLLGNEIKLTHNQIIEAIGQATNNIIRKHSKEYDEDFTKIKAEMLKKIYYALKIGGVDDLKFDGEKIIIPEK